ncbi:MAG: ParB/RepB/Spo0J family partition protein [Deltaproteobacteria bacterium]|jgi:ParB family chromosome partitioning protein|nr:ParB/RepB/Spo0J family partition protein [Deltaproteobacteria bacterium]
MPSKSKNSGLGKGIDGLLPPQGGAAGEETAAAAAEAVPSGKPLEVPVSDISANPDQPRKYFNAAEMDTLTESIRQKGVIEPLVVRKKEIGYELVAGHRRLIAADKAGLKTVPVIIREMGDDSLQRLEIALIENIIREGLNPIEEAEAFRRLDYEFGMTDLEVAKLVGKERPTVTNSKRLLDLPEEIKDDIRYKRLTSSHGLAVLQVADKGRWMEARGLILSQSLSVRKSEALAKKFNREAKRGTGGKPDDIKLSSYYESLEKSFSESLGGLKVRINYKGSNKSIEIRYADNEEIERVMAKLGVSLV